MPIQTHGLIRYGKYQGSQMQELQVEMFNPTCGWLHYINRGRAHFDSYTVVQH